MFARMSIEHVEIHDPFAKNNVNDPTSQTTSMDNTVEFRLLMAYSQRRRPKRAPAVDIQGQINAPAPQTPEKVEEAKTVKKRKKKGVKRMFRMLSCIKPPRENNELSQCASIRPEAEFRCSSSTADDVEEKDALDDAAGKLTAIADEIPFIPPEIEEDGPKEISDVEKVIALLLRETGDKLNEETKDINLVAELFQQYSFFENVMKTLLRRMGLVSSEPDHPGPQASPAAQIAVTCEATTRLLTLTSVPQRRMLGYGARYLQDYYSTWVMQNGGYVEILHSDDDDEDVE